MENLTERQKSLLKRMLESRLSQTITIFNNMLCDIEESRKKFNIEPEACDLLTLRKLQDEKEDLQGMLYLF